MKLYCLKLHWNAHVLAWMNELLKNNKIIKPHLRTEEHSVFIAHFHTWQLHSITFTFNLKKVIPEFMIICEINNVCCLWITHFRTTFFFSKQFYAGKSCKLDTHTITIYCKTAHYILYKNQTYLFSDRVMKPMFATESEFDHISAIQYAHIDIN